MSSEALIKLFKQQNSILEAVMAGRQSFDFDEIDDDDESEDSDEDFEQSFDEESSDIDPFDLEDNSERVIRELSIFTKKFLSIRHGTEQFEFAKGVTDELLKKMESMSNECSNYIKEEKDD